MVLKIKNLKKTFGEICAVDGVNFDVSSKEFVSILGPSGSGKSTILRMIAGFESPSSGSIIINGENVENVPPFQRNINMVFQNLALFPHLNVSENIAYGLKQSGVSKKKRSNKVDELLEVIQLEGYHDRDINQLSGGEQQRVALARALINDPEIVLFDEPLASLDRKLRQHMKSELRRIQDSMETTFLYVTHDQEVALSISDKMIILNEGRVEQIGTPQDVYESPESEFVGEFIGDLNKLPNGIPQSNYFDKTPNTSYENKNTNITIRPNKVSLSNGANKCEKVGKGTIKRRMYDGSKIKYLIDFNGSEWTVYHTGGETYDMGESIPIYVEPDELLFFEEDENE